MATKKTVSKKAAKAPAKKAAGTALKTKVEKTVSVAAPKKVKAVKVARKVDGLNAQVFGTDGKEVGTLSLPSEVFGVKINTQLMSQFVRVYLANQRAGGANTKTRGEVEGSTRKIYKQKGTGRARHGNIRAHIFVGGGVAFGPVTHDFSLTMPTKMKRKALASALTSQLKEGAITIVEGLEKLELKTKAIASSLKALGVEGRSLIVLSANASGVSRIARNIEGISIVPATSLNTYDVLTHKHIVIMKDAVALVQEIVNKK